MTTQRLRLGLVWLTGLSVVACSSDDAPSSESVILTSPDRAGVLDAVVRLEVLVDDGCVFVTDTVGEGLAVSVLWPFGTEFDPSAGVLTTPAGSQFRAGDSFEGGGGFLDDGSDIIELAEPGSRTTAALACLPTDDFYAVGSFGDEAPVSVPPQALPPGVTSTTPS